MEDEVYVIYDVVYDDNGTETTDGPYNNRQTATRQYNEHINDGSTYVVLRRIVYDLFNEDIDILEEYTK